MRHSLLVEECCRPPPHLAVRAGRVINVTAPLRPRRLWQLTQLESMVIDALWLFTQ